MSGQTSGTPADAPEPVRTEEEMGYMETAQIASILGFKVRAIRDMCQRGEIPSIYVGGEYRVEKRAFREWLVKRSTKGKDEGEKIAQAQ